MHKVRILLAASAIALFSTLAAQAHDLPIAPSILAPVPPPIVPGHPLAVGTSGWVVRTGAPLTIFASGYLAWEFPRGAAAAVVKALDIAPGTVISSIKFSVSHTDGLGTMTCRLYSLVLGTNGVVKTLEASSVVLAMAAPQLVEIITSPIQVMDNRVYTLEVQIGVGTGIFTQDPMLDGVLIGVAN